MVKKKTLVNTLCEKKYCKQFKSALFRISYILYAPQLDYINCEYICFIIDLIVTYQIAHNISTNLSNIHVCIALI